MAFWNSLIDKYYDCAPDLKELLLVHSRMVARKALEVAEERSLDIDRVFVEEAAMLHDIGIIRTHAPSILCHGSLPYICHGVEGRKILEAEGLRRHALVCERHTGSGLTIDDIRTQNLPLPLRDMCPVTLEERLICYADKFFSKSGNPTLEKSLQQVESELLRHGPDTLARFRSLLPC